MNLSLLKAEYDRLVDKQYSASEAVDSLRQIERELLLNRNWAKTWGQVAVISHALLVPLNVIVNAFEAKPVASLYQTFVKELYADVSMRRRRPGRTTFANIVLERGVIGHLQLKGLHDYIPGVNIVFGLVEDSVALVNAAIETEEGNREIAAIAFRLRLSIGRAQAELNNIGIRRAQVQDRLARAARTA